MAVSKHVRAYREAWDKENTHRISVKLNKNTDAALIEKIKSVPSVAGYVKSLIREDIRRGGE